MLGLLLPLASAKFQRLNAFSGKNHLQSRVRAIPQLFAATTAADAKSNSTIAGKTGIAATSVSSNKSSVPHRANATSLKRLGNATLPKKFGNATLPKKFGNATLPKKFGNATLPKKFGNATLPKKFGNATLPRKFGNATLPKKFGNASALVRRSNATRITHSRNATATAEGISAPAKKPDEAEKRPDNAAKPGGQVRSVPGPVINNPLQQQSGSGEILDMIHTFVSKTIGIVIILGVVVILVMVLGGLRLAHTRRVRNAEIAQAEKPLLDNEQFL
jgi:hypothetical protein